MAEATQVRAITGFDTRRSAWAWLVAAGGLLAADQALKQVVAELSPREQNIVKQRWLTDEPQTLEELGAAFGVSKERVRQLEERAKKRMRERLEQIVGEPIALTA